jgi:predicted ATP-binding protein involved in virulence
MQVRRLQVERYRGIEFLELHPSPRTVLVGPNNAGKSTVLDALDLLLHTGAGRPRPAPSEIDYFDRDPSAGFRIEALVSPEMACLIEKPF